MSFLSLYTSLYFTKSIPRHSLVFIHHWFHKINGVMALRSIHHSFTKSIPRNVLLSLYVTHFSKLVPRHFSVLYTSLWLLLPLFSRGRTFCRRPFCAKKLWAERERGRVHLHHKGVYLAKPLVSLPKIKYIFADFCKWQKASRIQKDMYFIVQVAV